MKQAVATRIARVTDAPELAELTTQLGYPSTPGDIERRLPALLESSDHLVLVAVDARDRPVAWLHAVVRRVLESDSFVQVAGLAVDAGRRGAGIGSQLLAGAEQWALEAGFDLIRVRSNVIRERAHAFYVRAGYALAKTSHLFAKHLP
jgi:GNAT superfamily N-acetyltransferase